MTARPSVRLATAADLEGIARVLAANGEALDQPGVVGYPYLEFLLERGRVEVANVDGVVVGFGSVIRVGEASMVTDLFVDPGHHGQGIGTALLSATLGDAQLRLTFSSADPRALPAYARAGMQPTWPSHYVRAEPAAVARLAADTALVAEVATVDETAEAGRALTGIDRRADFAFYAAQPDAAGFVIRDRGAVAGVAWAHRDDEGHGRALAHASIAAGADAARVAAAAFRAAARDDSVWGCVPGPHPALAQLLEAGAGIVDRDTYCTSDPGWLDPERILPNPGLL
jgi:GNAT superfamily N-acetyltransferase